MFRVSPGITVSEIDLSSTIPAVSTTSGGFAGVFQWGPADKIILVTSENDLVAKFGKPSGFNGETWFTAANFLSYSNSLNLVRTTSANTYSAIANVGTANVATSTIDNEDLYDSVANSFTANVLYVAKYPGDLGNSLKVSVCDTSSQFSSSIDLAGYNGNTSFTGANTLISIAVGSNTANVVIANSAVLAGNTPVPQANLIQALFSTGDIIKLGNTSIGKQDLKITAVGNVNVQNTSGTNTGIAWFNIQFDNLYRLSTDYTSNTVNRYWEYYSLVNTAPGTSAYVDAYGNSAATDEMHVAIVDEDGRFSSGPGTVLEIFQGISRATDAKTLDGSANYYKTVINNGSKYLWVASDRSTAPSSTANLVASASGTTPLTLSLSGGTNGADETTITMGDLASGFDMFKDAETIDVSLLLSGRGQGGTNGEQLGNYLIDNIAEVRKDLVVFLSPMKNDVVGNTLDPEGDVKTWAQSIRSSSYAVLDSGYKYQYDKYNDVFRWIPLNGDLAGLCVNTDTLRDPWWSPAGFNRGFIKNVVKLAFNPNEAQRDVLYSNRVNPVVTFRGQGTVLYGDKTALDKSSAFNRINVRRLFIVLEKAIAKAAQSLLFEFNDDITRSNFKNMVEPFLRDIQGRRGITAFKVVCDDSNNTGEVIDQNRFVGDIYIQPAHSISFIQLNFVAVRSDVSFDEIIGKF